MISRLNIPKVNGVFTGLRLIPIGADLLDLRMAQSVWIGQLQVIVHWLHGISGHHNFVVCNLGKRISGFHRIYCVFVFALCGYVAIVAGLFDAIDRLEAFVGIVEDLYE